MNDYLGIQQEATLELLLQDQKFDRAKQLSKYTWEQQKIPSFKFWHLLSQGKGQEAMSFKSQNVLTRNSPCGVYIAFKYCPEDLEKIITSPITNSEKQTLLQQSLLLSVKAKDPKFLESIMKLGANISHNKNEALRIGCAQRTPVILKSLAKFGQDLSCENNYAFKQAFNDENIAVLSYLEKQLKCIPLTEKEVLNALIHGKLSSIKWMCQTQSSMHKFKSEFDNINYFQFCSPDSPTDCPVLARKYLNHLKVTYSTNTKKDQSRQPDQLIQGFLNIIPNYALDQCINCNHSEISQLAQKVKNKKLFKIKVTDCVRKEDKELMF
jgi:hypothetical protein